MNSGHKSTPSAHDEAAHRFIISMKSGEGKLTDTDRPFTGAYAVARAVHIAAIAIPALAALCELPFRVTVNRYSRVRSITYSVAATRRWLAEQAAKCAAVPIESRAQTRDVLRVWRKIEARRIKKERTRAWKAVVASGLAEQTVKTINSWRTRGDKPVTAEDCANGAVNGNLMLECAREVIVDAVARNPLCRNVAFITTDGASGSDKAYAGIIAHKIAEAGLDFSVDEQSWI